MWDSISKVNLIIDSLVGITSKSEENLDLIEPVRLKSHSFEDIMISLSEGIRSTLSRQFINQSNCSMLNMQSEDLYKSCSQI